MGSGEIESGVCGWSLLDTAASCCPRIRGHIGIGNVCWGKRGKRERERERGKTEINSRVKTKKKHVH